MELGEVRVREGAAGGVRHTSRDAIDAVYPDRSNVHVLGCARQEPFRGYRSRNDTLSSALERGALLATAVGHDLADGVSATAAVTVTALWQCARRRSVMSVHYEQPVTLPCRGLRS